MAGQRQKPVDSLTFRRGGRGGEAIDLTQAAGYATEIPDPPAGIVKAAREAWVAFWRSDVSALVNRHADLTALRRWAVCLSERERVWAKLRKEWTVTGSMGQRVINPLGTYMDRLTREIARYEDKFGMTPQARMRLGVTFGHFRRAMQDAGDAGHAEIEEMPDDVMDAIFTTGAS